MLGAGVVFELPMISFFLTKLGILNPAFMKKYRKHAIVIIMCLPHFLLPVQILFHKSYLLFHWFYYMK